MVPIAVIVEINTMMRNIRKERENEVIMLIKMAWGHCFQCSRRFLLDWALVLRSANKIIIKKRDLIMEIPIIQSIERKNVNVTIPVLHHVVEGTIRVVGTVIVNIPLGWTS